ncbi:hypothetical protein BROC_00011 [Candidatus Brocadiaceae bacterium]|nr:hypothetical protein BROC_00011 [Candidatus Brocadiaceae bacterium]
MVTNAAQVLLAGTDFKSIIQYSTLCPFWWPLTLGTCLGRNGSPVEASANVITIGLAEKAG